MITIIAFISMFIDHIGYIFFPTEIIFRYIGRLAFPLFAWGIVRGFRFTKNKLKYFTRIGILATISQIPVILLFGNEVYNVCFTLLFGLLSIFIIEFPLSLPLFPLGRKEIIGKYLFIILKILLITLLLVISEYLKFDYSIYGILTIIGLHIFWQQKKSILFFFVLTLMFYGIHYQLFSLVAIVLLYFTSLQKYDFKINYWIKYLFYPVHLALLYGIYWVMVR